MQNTQSTLAVVGADSKQGIDWLAERFPEVRARARAVVLHLRTPELDAVLWAEALRLSARKAGVRLSIGLAGRTPGASLGDAAEAAGHAFQRAFSLGGDITVTHANLLRAAA